MRVSKEDIEKILNILYNFKDRFPFLENIFTYVKDLIASVSQNERTIVARVKLRIANEIEKISSKDQITQEDRIKIRTMEEIMQIIKEEESKRDISDIFE
ncbi:MAG: hypothetical protein NZ927_08650 [Candidatus Calescibacterium sp.]|nr:hypothetical protein [Candidatus Calescibacterium sp.]MCX7733437.1 hypothetical protein [bacterium]MDW8087536.1 hypothetical protein [Candidatus Calescibacterium sp.]